MKRQPSPHEQQIVDEVAPRPKPQPFWKRWAALLVVAWETLRGRKGGG